MDLIWLMLFVGSCCLLLSDGQEVVIHPTPAVLQLQYYKIMQ